MADRGKWCCLGVEDHGGVARVGGRLGAALGPRAFTEQLTRVGEGAVRPSWRERLGYHGNLAEADYARVAERMAELYRGFKHCVVVGGGNDHAYSQVRGLKQALGPGKRLGCINVDAHLDLRPYDFEHPERMGSGSPFRRLIEEKVIEPARFIEFGAQALCNSGELWDYAKRRKIRVVGLPEIQKRGAFKLFTRELAALARRCDAVAVCVDLDVVQAAEAPGVSAPAVEGLSSAELLQIAEASGAHDKVRSFGVFELNPLHDIDHRTARLAAHAVARFASETG